MSVNTGDKVLTAHGDLLVIGERVVDMIDRVRVIDPISPDSKAEQTIIVDGAEYIIHVWVKK